LKTTEKDDYKDAPEHVKVI